MLLRNFARLRLISLKVVEVMIYFVWSRPISLNTVGAIICFARGRRVDRVQPLPCRIFYSVLLSLNTAVASHCRTSLIRFQGRKVPLL